MKRLGSLLLPDALLWSDRYTTAPVAQTMSRTLGGTPVLWHHALPSGQPITLEAKEESAFLDLTSVESLMAMAQTPGAIFSLIWDERSLNVLFRHHDPPALAFAPLWPGDDHFTGVIRLLQVD